MREFIVDALKHAKETGKISGEYTGWKDNNIKISGTVRNDLADFEIVRSNVNGHRISAVPVYKMPLIDENITYIADLAVENL